MSKKLTLPAMAVAAVAAFAVPAVASATPQQVTVPVGTKAPLGTPILGTSTNTVTQTELGELTCPTVTLSGKISENTGSTFAGTGSGTTTGTCNLVVEGSKKEIKSQTSN